MNQPINASQPQTEESKSNWSILIFSFVFIALIVAGYFYYVQRKPADNPAPAPAKPITVTANVQGIAAADNNFGFNLYQQVLTQDKDKNVFISPASIAMALTMAYNGADKETATAMATTLNLSGLDLTKVNKVNADLMQLLKNNQNAQVNIANSMWANKDFQFDVDFVKTNQTSFSAELQTLDFSDAKSADVINAWVNKQTNGKIQTIVSNGIPPQTILYLINAVYFKSNWAEQFEKSLTQDKDFQLADGTTKKVPTMSQGGSYQYAENNDFQAVQLPYKDNKTKMYVFLPSKKSTLAIFQNSLTPDNWKKWLTQFKDREGDLQIPKFKTEHEITLNEALKAVGMEIAFDDMKANFTKMVKVRPDQNVYIAEVLHKTFVQVDETGTEAAAVTSVRMGTTSIGIDEPTKRFEMIVDRPFFFVIRNEETGLNLFMGSILDPTK